MTPSASGLGATSTQRPGEGSVQEPDSRGVTIVTDNFGGGTGQHLVDMLGHRDTREWPTRILCYGVDEGLAPPEGVSYRRRRYRKKLVRFPIPQMRVLWDLRRELRGWNAIFHAYFFWPIMYGRILKRLGLVKVLVENREDLGFKYGRVHRWALRRLKSQTDLVICVSPAVQQATIANEALPEGKTRVVENGVRIPPVVGERREEARRRLGLAPGHVAVGMVANLNRPVKAVDRFIGAIPLIRSACPEARFVIAGDGHLRAGLEAQAARLDVDDVLTFLGRVSDMDGIYGGLDLSVLTSESEGLSITILESMSHGLPVVVTAVGGNPGVVIDGETGLLVPFGDREAFAEAVIRLCKEPDTRTRMGRAARQRCEERYDIRTVSQRYEALYESLLGGSHDDS